MPPVVAAVAVAAVASVLGASLFTVAVVALSAYSVASVLAQKIPTFPTYSRQIKDRKIMLRSSNQTRTLVYGEVKVSGPLVFASVSGADNEFLHLVIPLASHEVNAIGDVYFNDKLSTFYDQFATVQQDKIYYTANGSDYKATIDGTPYTESSVAALVTTLDGISGISAVQENVFGGFGQLQTQKIVLAGDAASDSFIITATTFISVNAVLVTARVEKVTATIEVYRISKHLGSDTQAADADLVSEVEEWTTAHQLKGIAYLYVRLKWDQDVWVTGIPNVSAIVQGKKVFDPRDSTLKYTNNWALNVADYLSDEDALISGAGTKDGFQASVAELDTASIIVAANASDESVALTVGQQNRYELNGTVNLAISPRKNLDAMVGAGAGSVVYTQGVFKLYAGVYTAPVKTLTIDDLAGKVKLRAKASRADSFNAIKGTFSDPDQFYEPVDFPPVTNALYKTQDGDEQIFADIELGYTTNITRAQRIAKIALEKSRQGITLNFPANLSALELVVNDVVRIDVDQLGWGGSTGNRILLENGDFLLMESGDFLLMESAAGKQFKIVQWTLNPDGSIDLTLNEEASGIYDWNKGEETVIDLAPNTNLPDPFTVAAPTNLVIVSLGQSLVHEDGTITERLKVTWDAPVSDTIARYEVQFKRTDGTVWQTVSSVDVFQELEFFISPVIKDIAYDVRARSISTLGIRSSWLTVTEHLVDASRNVTLATFAASNWTERTSGFGASSISTAAHDGSGLWVIGGDAGKVATSPDGITWTLRTSGFGSESVRSAAHDGSGLWVIAGGNTTPTLATSPDGITWTLRTSGFGADIITAVAHDGSGLWVIVGSSGKLATSPDGITWTLRTSGFSGTDINGVAHDGSGLWVIVGSSGKLATSPDGITWTLRTSGFGTNIINNVDHDGSGLWVIVGAGLTTSPDGITWTVRTSSFGAQQIQDVAHGSASGLWVAVAFSDKLATSSDGITWIQRTPGLAGDSVFAINNDDFALWVASGANGKLITSLFT